MKNVMKSIGLVLLSVALFACSGNSSKPQGEERTSTAIRIDGSEVYGDAGAYFALVPGDYKVNVKDGKVRLKLRLKVLKSIGENGKIKHSPMLTFLDEDGAQIDISMYGVLSNEDQFLSFLRSEVGTEREILFINDYLDGAECENLLSKAEGVSIDGLSLSDPVGDLFDEVAKQAEKVDDADIEEAVEASKAVLEASKSAIDMLNQLDGMMK